MYRRLKNFSLICAGCSCAMPASLARPFSALFTSKYSVYLGNSFMMMKMKNPTTAAVMRKLIRVIPLW